MGGFGGEDLVQQFFVDRIEHVTDVVGDEVKHMHVLRLKVGDEVLLSDGTRLAKCLLTDLQKTRAQFELIAEVPSTEPPYEITLFQGLPKGDKLDLIVQKAVELGAAKIVPVQTSRTVVKWDEHKARSKVERLNKIALEAAKQSHRVVRPAVEELCSWQVFWISGRSTADLNWSFGRKAPETLEMPSAKHPRKSRF